MKQKSFHEKQKSAKVLAIVDGERQRDDDNEQSDFDEELRERKELDCKLSKTTTKTRCLDCEQKDEVIMQMVRDQKLTKGVKLSGLFI
jgi:hypothetical protein